MTPRPAPSVEAALAGELGQDDLRMSPDVLRHQADVAQQHGNPHLAENLRRAAELVNVDDEDVMALYEALRPHRSTAGDLDELAARLERQAAGGCASLVREAAAVYARQGLLR